MKRVLITCIACATVVHAFAQDPERYDALIREAYALYEQKQFAESAARYSAAFQSLGWKGYPADRYNAACSWALAGVPDSAFFSLIRLAEKQDYANSRQISADPDLAALHRDPRWGTVMDLVEANKVRLTKNLDGPLAALLDSIREEDQGTRHQIDAVEAKYGRDSREMKAHWRTMREKDSTNLIVVRRILDERGWLGEDVVGRSGNSTLFLVIQHADLPVQEKYLPMMRTAVKKGNARGSDLALLEDRVLMRKGRRQIYGSQIGRDPETGEFYLHPLDDPENVDKRRAAMGLGPLEDYLKNWDLLWDPAEYRLQLPILEQRYKVINR
ncbi:MAG: hypothetical protein IPL52_15730 [Flavobacteriales bacterium]|nr:hypothetical protein [Flavobacteriales bacterium]